MSSKTSHLQNNLIWSNHLQTYVIFENRTKMPWFLLLKKESDRKSYRKSWRIKFIKHIIKSFASLKGKVLDESILQLQLWTCHRPRLDLRLEYIFLENVHIPGVPKKMTRLYNVISSKILNMTSSNFLQ